MKKYIILIIVLSLISFYSCDKAKSDWEKAQKTNTIKSYQEYIKLYPSAEYTVSAIDSLDWFITKKSDSYERYKSYITKHPESKNKKIAEQYINDHLSPEKQTAIDLMFAFWYSCVKPNEDNGYIVTGADNLMVNMSSGKMNGIAELKNKFFSQSILNELIKYKDVKCDIVVKDVERNYLGTQTFINEKSKFLCKFLSHFNFEIEITKGEFGLQKNKEFYINDGTTLILDKQVFVYSKKKWLKE